VEINTATGNGSWWRREYEGGGRITNFGTIKGE
jgi:hypothetical protein